jgi:hypothetical protein
MKTILTAISLCRVCKDLASHAQTACRAQLRANQASSPGTQFQVGVMCSAVGQMSNNQKFVVRMSNFSTNVPHSMMVHCVKVAPMATADHHNVVSAVMTTPSKLHGH